MSTSEVARTTPSEAARTTPTEAQQLAGLEGKKYSVAERVLDQIDPSYLVFDARDDDFPVALYESDFPPTWVVCWVGRQSDDTTGTSWLAVTVAPRSHCDDSIPD